MNNAQDSSINRETLKNRLQQLEQKIQLQERHTRQSRRWIGAAFGLSCLVILGGLFSFRYLQDARLFSRYYEPYPNVISFIERGETVVERKTQALQWYDQGHYAEALSLFEDLYKPHHTAPDILFYAAMCCMETEKPDKAQHYLAQTLQHKDKSFATQANWYMALLYLKKNERKKARQHLQALIQQPDSYTKKATQLLNEL